MSQWWERLTKQEKRPLFLAPDFDRWLDESDAEMELRAKVSKDPRTSTEIVRRPSYLGHLRYLPECDRINTKLDIKLMTWRHGFIEVLVMYLVDCSLVCFSWLVLGRKTTDHAISWVHLSIWLITVDIDLAHVAEVMFVRSLHCNVTPSPLLTVLFGRKLLCIAHT